MKGWLSATPYSDLACCISCRFIALITWVNIIFYLDKQPDVISLYAVHKRVLYMGFCSMSDRSWRYIEAVITFMNLVAGGGTTAAAPPPFRPGNPTLCGSHLLVTPQYYCRLGDLLCCLYMCMCLLFCCILFCLLFLGFLYFCSVFPSVLWYCWSGLLTCKTVSQTTSTLLVETLNHAQSINQL